MVLKRYIVEVDAEQVHKLSAEQIALATRVGNGSSQLLIFRDRFVACKIAILSGGTFHQGRVVDGDTRQGGFALEGRTLMLEQPSLTAEA